MKAPNVDKIVEQLQKELRESGKKGFVIGLGGGVDSSVVAVLCQKATKNVVGLIMPCQTSPLDMEYAQLLAQAFSFPTIFVDLLPTYKALTSRILVASGLDQITKDNIKARLRMICLQAHADQLKYLFAGTLNKSDIRYGFFTKYGDGAGDIFPIGELIKSEIRELAKELGIPGRIILREPTRGFRVEQTDKQDIGEENYPAFEDDLIFGKILTGEIQLTPRSERISLKLLDMRKESVSKRECFRTIKLNKIE